MTDPANAPDRSDPGAAPSAPSEPVPTPVATASESSTEREVQPSAPVTPEAPLPTGVVAGAPGPAAVEPPRFKPNFVFLAVVSALCLAADLGTKQWATSHLADAKSFLESRVELIPNHLAFVFARNKGGAWGLLQEEQESVRKPFFLAISVAAILFIVSLYRKLGPEQRALKWGLPLVLGGALGNLIDRVRYGHVVDFIDFRADWMAWVNEKISGPGASDHWPTFNIADVAICAGVALMAVDMFTSRKARKKPAPPPPAPGAEPAPIERS